MAVYLVCYIISFILARQHFYMLSGLVLITAALWLYIKDYRETGNLIHLRGLFCLFFVGGQGISCFKLSRLQTDWDLRTWVCLGLAVLTFWIVFEVLHRIYDGWSAADMQSVYRFYASAESPLQAKRLLHSMAALVVISFLAFFFGVEAGLCAAVRIRCAPCLVLFPCQRCPLLYGFLRAGAQSVRGVQSYDIPQGKRTDQRSGILAGIAYGGAVPGRAGALRVQVPADSGRGHGRIYLYFHGREH